MNSRPTTGKLTSALVVPLIVVGALLLIFALIASFHVLSQNPESISIQWKQQVKLPVCLAMSQDDRFYGAVDKEGNVQFYDQGGHLLWNKNVEGATDVMIAKNGESVLVYSRLNPIYQEVCFFRGDGRPMWTHRVDGSVWSGAVSPDGMYAAVTTGKGFLYAYRPDPNHPRYRRWRLDGIGHCVTFSPDNRRVIAGTWQKSGLACYDVDGTFLWRRMHDTDRQYELEISADGKRILGILPGRQHDPKMEIHFWDSEGNLLWTHPLDAFDGHALVSPESQYVAISYAGYLAEHGSRILQRKVAVYKADGKLLWQKGGLFFGPHLIALSPSGSSVIVSDGEKSLYNIDKNGRILSKLTLGGAIRKTICSEDGNRMLVYCDDGCLYLIRVG